MKRSKGFWLASGIAAFLLLPVAAVGQTDYVPYVPGDLVVLDHNLGRAVQTDSAGTLKRVVSTDLSTSNPVTRPQYLALGYATDGSVAAIFVSIPELDKIVRVDAVTGAQTTAASGGYLTVPRGVTLDNRGRLIVATAQGIVRVDVATGQQTLVAGSGIGFVMAPYDVAVQADDQIIVADPVLRGVYRVDPGNGNQALISTDFNLYPTAVTVDEAGSLLTTEVVTAYSAGRVVRLNPVTGSRTNVTASDQEQYFGYPAGVDVEETGGILVADNTVTSSLLGGVFRVDPVTGRATKLLSNAYYGAVYIDVMAVKTPQPRLQQTVTFGALPNKVFGDPDFPVSASASSGLPVSFTVGATDNCTISGSIVHITGAGSCTVTAMQAGDANYNPAAPTSQSFSINKALTTVTILSSSPNPSNNQTSVTFTVSVSAVAPGLGGPTGSVQLLDGTTVIGTSALSGGAALITVPPMTAGTHSITAIYGGSANFLGNVSTSWTQTVSATTPVGTNITENIVQPPVSLTFSNVIAAGETTVTTSPPINDLQPIIGYFSLPGINLPFDGFLIRTTATFSGPIIITFTLPAGIDSTTFSETRILHDVGGTWIDQTILSPNSPAPNFATRQISAEVTSLSPFVIARWRLGPRSALRNVATVLRTLTGTTQDQKKIQSALGDLNKTMDPRLWVGNSETTLQSRAGGALFNDAKDAVTQLGNLFKQTTSRNLRNLLPSLIRNLTNAGRELARTAIATATAAGGKSSDLTHASGELARGDTAQLKGDLQSSMEHYRKAWMFAVSREVED